MDNKYIIAIVVVIIIAIIVGLFATGAINLGGNDTVKIGYLPSDHDAALFVADAQGKYAEKGIKTELVQFNNGGDLMTAMASGDVDIGYVGIAPVLSSVSAGVPVKIISAAQTEGSGILVTNDSKIDEPNELAGETIATPGEASIQHVLLSYYLEENGLSLDDINESAMKVPSINDALKTNNIPAAITFQPYVSIAGADEGVNELVDSSEILPNHPCCVVVASDNFIKNHESTVKDIIAIHENATKFINDNIDAGKTDEIVKLLPDDIVSDADIEVESLESFPFISGLSDSYKDDVDAFQDLEVELGILNETIPQETLYWEA